MNWTARFLPLALLCSTPAAIAQHAPQIPQDLIGETYCIVRYALTGAEALSAERRVETVQNDIYGLTPWFIERENAAAHRGERPVVLGTIFSHADMDVAFLQSCDDVQPVSARYIAHIASGSPRITLTPGIGIAQVSTRQGVLTETGVISSNIGPEQ